uniref:Neurotransmitter-gated ion-channel ligand-binding domain-containing protein n=1 Tax=Trichuris muris TaxID=70415 RepID=A0A5S6QRJ0_TRIMR
MKLILLLVIAQYASCNSLQMQLFEDLLYDYNKIPRPVRNASDLLTIKFGAALIRIIDVDEKNQMLTTNLWLDMQWNDSKLVWDPETYGGIKKVHIPAELLWTPDIILYNNAAGDPDITIFNDAVVYYDGTIVWKPPAIYKSFCSIDVTWFPYDTQECVMKFGMWTYIVVKDNKIVHFLEVGMDLSYYYRSAEWDLLSLTSERHEVTYASCCGPSKYVDITFYFSLRRKTLFYTVNLIIPCFLISFCTTLVFYLSDHKITFSISMLVTLTVFFLVLIEIIPPNSLVIPMFGRYLLSTLVLVILSIVISVVTVNLHFRRASTHHMPYWMRRAFLEVLPRYLLMEYPGYRVVEKKSQSASAKLTERFASEFRQVGLRESPCLPRKNESAEEYKRRAYRHIILRILHHVRFIGKYFAQMEEDDMIASDWNFVGMVIDRLFLVVFSIFNMGSLFIILQAPSLYDERLPLSIPVATRPLGQDTLGASYEQ